MGTWVWTASNTLSFLQQTALPSLRIRAKLHHGYAPAMVTLPKRCCGCVLSPWLHINPPSTVWSQKICSLRNISLRAGRPHNLSVPSLLDSVQWVVLFQESDWSKTRSSCAEVLQCMASSAAVTASLLFFSYSLLHLERKPFRRYTCVCSAALKQWAFDFCFFDTVTLLSSSCEVYQWIPACVEMGVTP